MKKLLIAFPVLAALAAAAAVADSAHVSRAVIRSVEKSLDDRLLHIWADTPSVVSPTRGLYLDGYGAVFTMEMITVSYDNSMMAPRLTPQRMVEIKQKQIERVPQLEKALTQALMEVAASLDSVPLDERVVIEADLLRYPWQDGAGYPAEVLVESTRRKLQDVKRANGAGLDAAVHVTERN
jgi:hypothetical protein